MHNIYELATTIFKAQTDANRLTQFDILKKEIRKLLNKKEDGELIQAVQEAVLDGQMKTARLIEDMVQETLGIVYDNFEQYSYRSDLFAIPILTVNNAERTKFPSLGTTEDFLNEKLRELNLIPKKAEVILAPILLSHEMSKSMLFSKWYELHNNIIDRSENRHEKPIFNKAFYINSSPNVPSLNFLVGIVIQKSVQFDFVKPNIFSNEFYIDQDKEKFINAFRELVQSRTKEENTVLIYSPDVKAEAVQLGYVSHQDLLVDAFIKKYKAIDHVEFAVISVNSSNTFVIFAWNKSTNKILNYLLVDPFNLTMQESVDNVMERMTQTDRLVYAGNGVIELSAAKDYTNFNFQEYLNTEGATLLHSEEIID